MRSTALSLIVVLGVFGPGVLHAQTGAVDGRVANAETGQPLADVQVSLEGTDLGTISGADGTFRIEEVPSGRYTLRARSVGYGTVDRDVRVTSGQTVELEIELSEKAIELSTITVIGRRGGLVADDATTAMKAQIPRLEIPQSVSVVTGAQIEAQDAERLSQALRYTAGVQGETFGFEPRTTFLRMRGFDATTTGLYRDGLQLRNPGFAVSFDPVPYGAGRIEVPQGPASVLYGAGSAGGLVNFVSKRPTRQPRGEVAVEPGSFGRLQARADVSGPIDEDGTVSYRIIGLARQSGTQVDSVPFDRRFVAPSLSWRPTDATSWTVLGRYKTDYTRSSQRLPAAGTLRPNPSGELPVGTFTGEPDVDEYDRTKYSATSILEHETGDVFSFQQKTRYYSVDLDNVGIFTAALRDDMRTIDRTLFESFGELDGVALDNQARARFSAGPTRHDVLVGVDYQHVDVRLEQNFGGATPLDLYDPDYGAEQPDASPFVETETEQDQLGVYAQEHLTLADAWILSLNGRVDFASTDQTNVLQDTTTTSEEEELTGRAGLVYRSGIGLSPYASYSQSFQPSLGTDADGEPFEPERGEQVELGVKYRPEGANGFVSLAVYDLTRKNFLQTDPETFRQVQTGEASSAGVELEANASLASGLNAHGSFTRQDVEITESVVADEVGDRPAQVPESMASLWLQYTVQDGRLAGAGVGGGVRYQGSRFGDTPNTLEVPDATLVDAMAEYRIGDVHLQLNVQNLLDEHYVGSAFGAGAQDFATYGPERSIRGRLAYTW